MLAARIGAVVPHSLMERFHDARRRSDALFSVVRTESLYERPIPERHRIIFYVGHLEAFDRNLLSGGVLGLGRGLDLTTVNPEFDRLFAFGIDPVGGGLPSDVPSDWPALHAVGDYVREVRGALDQYLETALLDSGAPTRDGFPLNTLLNVAIEHRLMHLETLAYMLHQLPIDMKLRPAKRLSLVGAPVVHSMIAIPGGVVTLGLSRDAGSGIDFDPNFGWDNEYEAHAVEVPAFEIDQYKVTNRQYLEFVSAGGYEARSFWSDADWDWKTAYGILHPLFWKKSDSSLRTNNEWGWRAMFDELPLPHDWPVYVSHAEASAYARWAGKSLPTEEEWQRAAYGSPDGQLRAYPWGNEPPSSRKGNFNFETWDPMPVNSFPDGRSAFGVDDMLGNGWEWTSTAFAPFPGFEPFPFYRGYSADFFDGKHFVMKGGSARTAVCMLRPTFRNWFQAHYQYVYAGFRCVKR
jgi:iron(II)-dependent oxidoreductase